ncbi:hypothetical protein BST11_14500 [Mycobacterium alsense]|uniref:DUF732 domain-containing protein n=1 Tax=Mycobacterium alsense TaxID=324058 RepID=A0AA41XN25_9MYCO|nr:DUF732 domain-containing protein [Mycobacterium alsense]MCV7379123.1 DUF732 domain-containing protein [Mycobacterium alsense]OQZ90062.1 hypothetical protein BST11_14500 [Mycobacterium alsense]
MNVSPGNLSKVCAVVLSAAALVCAAPASADPTDEAFVTALENYGIHTDGRDTAIAHGHAVCAGLDRGHDAGYLALKLINDTKLNISTRQQAGFFLGASIAAYCPQYRGTLDPSLTWLQPFPPMM